MRELCVFSTLKFSTVYKDLSTVAYFYYSIADLRKDA